MEQPNADLSYELDAFRPFVMALSHEHPARVLFNQIQRALSHPSTGDQPDYERLISRMRKELAK